MAEIFDYGQFLENLSEDEWEELKEQYTNLDLSICLSESQFLKREKKSRTSDPKADHGAAGAPEPPSGFRHSLICTVKLLAKAADSWCPFGREQVIFLIKDKDIDTIDINRRIRALAALAKKV
jgi:hypothetical protein